ncbi:hypothetical protein HanPSC8_Chr09g0354721 [Helianthus annuus]|nr:hypothetical protein HanPSC8_Chr09g0354721 [Helianthus annuus]
MSKPGMNQTNLRNDEVEVLPFAQCTRFWSLIFNLNGLKVSLQQLQSSILKENTWYS